MTKQKQAGGPVSEEERFAESARAWIDSPEGRQALTESLERARKITSRFSESQRVDPDDLVKPFTL